MQCRVCTIVHCSTISTLLYMPGLYKSSLQYNFIFTIYAGSLQEFIAVQFHLYYIFRVCTIVHCTTISALLYMPGLYKNSLQYNFVCPYLPGRPVQQFVTVYFKNEIFANEILYYIFKAFFLIFFIHAFTLYNRLTNTQGSFLI